MAPFDTNNMCTIWVPLRDIPASGSGLVFVSGSHKDLALNFWRSQKQVLNMDLSKVRLNEERRKGEGRLERSDRKALYRCHDRTS
jgi:ectoine hydroxylase-related dioxygenase (phytanoyl-CoA dioxygenase family)